MQKTLTVTVTDDKVIYYHRIRLLRIGGGTATHTRLGAQDSSRLERGEYRVSAMVAVYEVGPGAVKGKHLGAVATRVTNSYKLAVKQ